MHNEREREKTGSGFPSFCLFLISRLRFKKPVLKVLLFSSTLPCLGERPKRRKLKLFKFSAPPPPPLFSPLAYKRTQPLDAIYTDGNGTYGEITYIFHSFKSPVKERHKRRNHFLAPKLFYPFRI